MKRYEQKDNNEEVKEDNNNQVNLMLEADQLKNLEMALDDLD